MAWAAAEAERRVQTKGGDRKSNGRNTHLIVDPRVYFAKQFAASDKYVRMVRKLLEPVDDWRRGDGRASRRHGRAARGGGPGRPLVMRPAG
jgi:hypothetical protein